MDSKLEIGFDPVFLDVITRLLDPKGSLAKKLPSPGQHHPWAHIRIIPGGNGFNFARALFLQGYKPRFWSKIDSLYSALLKKEEPNMRFSSIRDVYDSSNITVALETRNGEIQINDARHGIHPSELTSEARNAFKYSEINTYLNLGLNKYALELFHELARIVSDGTERVSIFDPSTLRNFTNWDMLKSWFRDYYSGIPGEKIVSLNEEEYKIFFSAIPRAKILDWVDYVIMHSSKIVEISSKNERIRIEVPSLSPPFATFVGIGDTFNAGLSIGLVNDLSIPEAVKQGIQWAQHLLLKGWRDFASKTSRINSNP